MAAVRQWVFGGLHQSAKFGYARCSSFYKPPAHRCPQRRQRVTEGTAIWPHGMSPWLSSKIAQFFGKFGYLTRPDPLNYITFVTQPDPTRPDPRVNPTRLQLWATVFVCVSLCLSVRDNNLRTKWPYTKLSDRLAHLKPIVNFESQGPYSKFKFVDT